VKKKYKLKPLNIQAEQDEVGGTCGANGEKEKRVEVIGRKARWKETTLKTKT
jgi:hypothetical protein